MDLYASRFSGVEGRSKMSCEKAARERRRLDFISEGGSLEILMHVCRMLSGMILAKGAPLMGSALKKHRKSLCADSAAISSLRSSCGTQPCMRCTLSKNTQPPSLVYVSSTPSAGFSCPCPIEMIVSLRFSTVFPREFARTSISLEGEYPGKRMKKMGVDGPLSSIIDPASKASWFTYGLPMDDSTNISSPAVMRSGRSARTTSRVRNAGCLDHSPGRGLRSQSSSSDQSRHSSEFFSMSLVSPLNGPWLFTASSADHWVSLIQLESSSVIGGALAFLVPLSSST
mmetsp:Transcript_46012/g.147009  ORF Transcript_46012/g.147009 Transcript_46012/m.147009 type:complete len:285 (+) Transcript_46012:546-1400(+)